MYEVEWVVGVMFIIVDVVDMEFVKVVVVEVFVWFGCIDVLVVNVGGYGFLLVVEIDDVSWEVVICVNFIIVFMMVWEVFFVLIEVKG